MVVHPFVFRLHRLYWAMTMCWVLFCSQTLGFGRRVYGFRPFGGAPLPLSIGIVYQRWPVFWDFSTRVYGIVCDLYAAVGMCTAISHCGVKGCVHLVLCVFGHCFAIPLCMSHLVVIPIRLRFYHPHGSCF